MNIPSETDIQGIIDRVHDRLSGVGDRPALTLAARSSMDEEVVSGYGIYRGVDEAVPVAKRTQDVYSRMGVQTRHSIIGAVGPGSQESAKRWA